MDVEAACEYVEWLGGKLKTLGHEELEQKAAGSKTHPPWFVLLARIMLPLVNRDLRILERGEALSRRDELRLEANLKELRGWSPYPQNDIWRMFLEQHPELTQHA